VVTAPGNSSCSTSTMIVKMVPGHDEDTTSSSIQGDSMLREDVFTIQE